MNQHDRLGPYRLLRRLGEGGMGVVHLALDPRDRQVAVKVLRSEVAGDDLARRRLAREVETMRRVRSRHIAEVLDADVTGSRPYIVTRYVAGMPLDDAVKQDGPLDTPSLLRVAHGVAEALAAVHAAGVIHRDLKPANVLILDGEPVLIDFGIAQAVDATRLTQTGMFIGTPGYLAPEIIEGHEAGPEVDVHAWAGTMLYAATGRPPFGKGTLEMVFYNITAGRANVDAAPAVLRPVLREAFRRDPARRPTAAELAARLARMVPGPGQTRPPVPDEIITVPDTSAVTGAPVTGTSLRPGEPAVPAASGAAAPGGGPSSAVPDGAASGSSGGAPAGGVPPGAVRAGAGLAAFGPAAGAAAGVASGPAAGVAGSAAAGSVAAPSGAGPGTPTGAAAGVGAAGPGAASGDAAGEFVSLLDGPPAPGGDPFPTVRVTGDELRRAGIPRDLAGPPVPPGRTGPAGPPGSSGSARPAGRAGSGPATGEKGAAPGPARSGGAPPGGSRAGDTEGDVPTWNAPPGASRPWPADPGPQDQGEVPTRRVRSGELDELAARLKAGHPAPGVTPQPGTTGPAGPGTPGGGATPGTPGRPATSGTPRAGAAGGPSGARTPGGVAGPGTPKSPATGPSGGVAGVAPAPADGDEEPETRRARPAAGGRSGTSPAGGARGTSPAGGPHGRSPAGASGGSAAGGARDAPPAGSSRAPEPGRARPDEAEARPYHQALFEQALDVFERTPHVRHAEPAEREPLEHAPTVHLPPGQAALGQASTVHLPPEATPLGAAALLRRPPVYGLAAWLALSTVAFAAVMAPVLVGVVVLLVVVLLRAAHLAQPELAAVRPAGAAAGDVVRVLGHPAALVKSLGVTLALVPVSLFLAVPVMMAASLLPASLPTVLGLGVAVVLWVAATGPGVTGPRRQLTLMLAAAFPSRSTATALAGGLGVLAALVLVLVVAMLAGAFGEAVWSPMNVDGWLDQLRHLGVRRPR
ncbi:hypothetical protein Sru01_44120 [Sphaerisporangium rufum]|uniref:Protein kinase domain-containing protein n=2 Tax=Sphaerisporangium rufum TaxID=1381558 RepID=A0A919R8T5_9ACTN|nr:hypothetical protein Sru01_44120 [Sphaerisporangium rufum]